jgi:CheY-like chemotaxis protein
MNRANIIYLPKPLLKRPGEKVGGLDDARLPGLLQEAPARARRGRRCFDRICWQVLRRAGYEKSARRQRREALTGLGEAPVDLVVLDLMMPGQKDGEMSWR